MTGERFDECMRAICSGNQDALKEIYEEYLPYIFSIINTVVGNRENAEDITSDFFIKLWTNSEKYVPGSGHKAFLATMARNMAIDFLRKYKREVLTEAFEGDYDDDDRPKGSITLSDENSLVGNNSLGANVDSGEKVSLVENEVISDMSLQDALNMLKPREREVINMKVIGELTFKEIAAIMNAPMGTVTWLYREGIERLRRCGYE